MNIKSYFSHDSNARNDTKILNLRASLGAEGYGIYFMILERLRECSDYTSVTDYNAIAFDLRVSSENVKKVVEEFGLFSFSEDGARFYSESFLRRMEIKDYKKKDISDKRRAAANKRWEKENKEDECKCNASAMQMHSKNMQNDAKEKQSKEKNSKENNITTTPPLYIETGDFAGKGGGLKEDYIKRVIEIFNYSGFSNITPSTKDTLISFAEMYPITWIEEAFKIASDGGKLNLNYVRGILNRWQTNGKDSFKKKPEKAKKTKFHNFKQITDDYSAEDLEEMAMRKQKEGFKKLGVDI